MVFPGNFLWGETEAVELVCGILNLLNWNLEVEGSFAGSLDPPGTSPARVLQRRIPGGFFLIFDSEKKRQEVPSSEVFLSVLRASRSC